MHSWTRTTAISTICAGWLVAMGCQQRATVSLKEEPAVTSTQVPSRPSATRPVMWTTQVPASRDAGEQITEAYDVGESADQVAEKLNRIVPALFPAEKVTIRSSPATRQIIVTGSPAVHELFGDLSPRPRAFSTQHVLHVFSLKNKKAMPWFEVVQAALDGEDATVVPDNEANGLIVRVAKKSLDRIAYLVAVLDRAELTPGGETADRLAMVFRLQHAKAADVIDVITRLYPRPASIPDDANPQEVLAGIVTASSMKGSEDTVLISAAPQLEPEIKALIPLLDTAKPAEVELSKVFALENADAQEVAVLLESLWKESDPRLRAMADTRTNSLIVQISIASLQTAAELVEELDNSIILGGNLKWLMRDTMAQHKPGAASRPATGPTADLPPWGEEVEGLRCRLVPDRSTLKQGEMPRVILYVRDQASRVLTSYFDPRGDSPWVSCELELDGRWHPVQLHGRDEPDGSKILVSLGNGPPRLGFPMRLWDATDGKQSPALAPGTHTLRAAFTVSVSAGTGVRPIRVVSKPVEIEILPVGDEATQPATRPAAGGSGDAGKVPESFITKTRKGENTKQTSVTPACLKPLLSSALRAFMFSCFRDPGFTPVCRWHQPCTGIRQSGTVRSRLLEHYAGSLSGTLVPVWKGQA